MDKIKGLIGNTPLIKIKYYSSIEDSVVCYILDKAIKENKCM